MIGFLDGKCLPPTTEVFNLNVLRAHYQACIWNHCMSSTPPDLNPCDFGWKKDNVNECLKVQMFSSDAKKSSHAKLRDVQIPCPQKINGKISQQKFRDFLQMLNWAHKLS